MPTVERLWFVLCTCKGNGRLGVIRVETLKRDAHEFATEHKNIYQSHTTYIAQEMRIK